MLGLASTRSAAPAPPGRPSSKSKRVLVGVQPLPGDRLQHLHLRRGVRRADVLDLPRPAPVRSARSGPRSRRWRSSPSGHRPPRQARDPGLVHNPRTKTPSQQQLHHAEPPEVAQVRSCRWTWRSSRVAFREVSVIEVREVLRGWLAGAGLRTVAEQAGVDRKTARRYVAGGAGRRAGPRRRCRGG